MDESLYILDSFISTYHRSSQLCIHEYRGIVYVMARAEDVEMY